MEEPDFFLSLPVFTSRFANVKACMRCTRLKGKDSTKTLSAKHLSDMVKDQRQGCRAICLEVKHGTSESLLAYSCPSASTGQTDIVWNRLVIKSSEKLSSKKASMGVSTGSPA